MAHNRVHIHPADKLKDVRVHAFGSRICHVDIDTAEASFDGEIVFHRSTHSRHDPYNHIKLGSSLLSSLYQGFRVYAGIQVKLNLLTLCESFLY